ncbi:MAG: energy transducer TonB [Kofleriaceae bacterium]|nr:energy transducer TonB [Myxococcales bacterium]MCB9564605.1 energy transducer TonB [Kofleriaceae bacterium]
MFENFVIAKRTRTLSPTILGFAAIAISSVLAGLLVYSWLKIDKLEAPSTGIQVGIELPPPPPPPKGGKKKKLEAKKDPTPKKIKPVDTVQPVKKEDKQEEPEDTSDDDGDEAEGDPNGQEGGQVGGVVGGQLGGVVGGVVAAPPPPPPPPPPPVAPQNIAPTALEASRIAGEKNIVPDDVTKTEISRSGKTRLVIPVKICLNASGTVKSVNILKASGFAAYDSKIQREMKAWKYRPFMVDGKAAPVCSAVTLIYVQKN